MARHGSLAEQLSALRRLVQQPETIEAGQTNWTVAAANDNAPEDMVDLREERRINIRPTLGEIMRSVATGDTERAEPSTIDLFVDGKDKTITVPGAIVRIGKLRFSDGSQMERCVMAGIDGAPVTGAARMPTGAMLGTKEVQERPLGGNGTSSGESNAWFCDVFGVEARAYRPSGKRRKGRNFSRDEAVAMLAEAVANTAVMPEVTVCPPGIAAGTARYADNFIGMKKAPNGNGGAVAWQDLSDKMAEREAFLEAERSLATEDRAALKAARTARSMADVGSSIGFHGKRAERRGKRALLAANDNLAAAVRKYVA